MKRANPLTTQEVSLADDNGEPTNDYIELVLYYAYGADHRTYAPRIEALKEQFLRQGGNPAKALV